jgi:Transposase DDE domain group 1
MSFSENKITEKNSTIQTDSTISRPKLFDLQPIDNKRVEVGFAAQEISSDGGLLLIKDVEQRISIIKAITACMDDTRHQSYVHHSLEEIAAQRIYQIVAGYEDANDCNKLRDDTILKMSVGRLPITGDALASQPTMTRFENTPRVRDLYDIARVFVDKFIESYPVEPPVIIIDCQKKITGSRLLSAPVLHGVFQPIQDTVRLHSPSHPYLIANHTIDPFQDFLFRYWFAY